MPMPTSTFLPIAMPLRSHSAARLFVAALALPASTLAQRVANADDRVGQIERATPIKTPEPASLTLMAIGLVALGGALYRRRRAIAD